MTESCMSAVSINLRRLGLEKCEICGEIGIRFTADKPIIRRKLATTYHGWLHPTIQEPVQVHYPPDASPEDKQEAEYSAITDAIAQALHLSGPTKFCLADTVSVEPFTEGGRFCPKCGERGQGEREWKGQRRFWHSNDRSCYLGMIHPRPRKPEIKCAKCGKPGRPFQSSGYDFIRHKKGQCRLGKCSDVSLYDG